jgi:hypothetical protein
VLLQIGPETFAVGEVKGGFRSMRLGHSDSISPTRHPHLNAGFTAAACGIVMIPNSGALIAGYRERENLPFLPLGIMTC